MTNAYLTALPVKMLRKLAGYSTKEGSYHLPRATIQPPESLRCQIFPFLDAWEARFQQRAAGKEAKAGGLDQDDTAGQAFIALLQRLRDVLLQDLAVMQYEYHYLPHYKQPFAAHPDWRPFAKAVRLANKSLDLSRNQTIEALAPELCNVLYNGQETLLSHSITQHNTLVSFFQQTLEKLDFLRYQFPLTITLGRAPPTATPYLDPRLHPNGAAVTRSSSQQHFAPPPEAVFQQPYPPLNSYSMAPPNPQTSIGYRGHREPPELPATHELPPYYLMQNVHTVADLWREWKEGIGGGPAVEKLELKFKAAWRASGKERTTFSRRKVIIDEIQGFIDSGMSGSMAVERVERLRGSRSMYQLSIELAKERRSRRA